MPLASLYALKNALKTNARDNQKCHFSKSSENPLMIARIIIKIKNNKTRC